MHARPLRALAALALLLAPITLVACGGDDDSSSSTTTTEAAADSGTAASTDAPTAALEPAGDSSDLVATIEQYYPGVPADQAEAGANDVCDGIKDGLTMDDLVSRVVEKFGGDGRADPTVEEAEEIIAIVRLKLDGCCPR